MKKNRIAFLLSDLRCGGAQNVAVKLSDLLNNEGYNIEIILFSATEVFYSPLSPVIDLNVSPSSNLLLRVLNILKRITRIRRIIQERNYDTVISFLSSANFYNALLRKHEHLSIVSIRNFNNKSILDMYLFELFVYSRTSKIVTVSKVIQDDLMKKFKTINKDKFRTIYNPVTPAKNFSNSKTRDTEFKLITVGRVVEQKAQWLIIIAFHNLVHKYPSITLDICGDGPYLNPLKELVSDLKISNKVFFHGEVNNVGEFLSKSDIFILSSIYEGFPNALIEAMSFGLPVISTNCKSGPEEILSDNYDIGSESNNHYGILVSAPVTAPNIDKSIKMNQRVILEIENAVITLINNQNLFLEFSNKSKNRVNIFSENNILSQWIDILS